MAVQNGHFELAVALLDAGADPNDQRTGIHAAPCGDLGAEAGRQRCGDPPPIGSGRLTSLQFVRALVKRGANVNARLRRNAPRHRRGHAAEDGRGDAVP